MGRVVREVEERGADGIRRVADTDGAERTLTAGAARLRERHGERLRDTVPRRVDDDARPLL